VIFAASIFIARRNEIMAFCLTQTITITATNAAFNMRNSLQKALAQASMVGAVAIGGVALAHPAQAASLDLATWTRFGDAQLTTSQAIITNATSPNSPYGSDDFSGITPVNYNVSDNDPIFPIDLFESSLTLPLGAVGLALGGADAKEGSAIQTIFNNVMAGDKFSFNWIFQTFDMGNTDRVFVAINNVLNPKANNTAINLTGNTPFSYTFTGAGTYRVAIGVVDVNDAFSSSILTVSNADMSAAAVPTPALLPGLVGLGLGVLRKRKLVLKTQ
jgi:hypothetical protein